MPEHKSSTWITRRREHPVRHLAAEHDEVLYQFGEFLAFVLLWRPVDHKHGLVSRCSVCMVGDRLARAYDQTPDPNCPGCYGTTFENGARAILWRPALVSDIDPETREGRTGEVTADRVMVETTSDVRAHSGDFFVRRDGTRWRLSDTDAVVLHTGFGQAPTQRTGAAMSAQREDDSAPAFAAGPTREQVQFYVDELSELRHLPPSTRSLDVLNGPLVV